MQSNFRARVLSQKLRVGARSHIIELTREHNKFDRDSDKHIVLSRLALGFRRGQDIPCKQENLGSFGSHKRTYDYRRTDSRRQQF